MSRHPPFPQHPRENTGDNANLIAMTSRFGAGVLGTRVRKFPHTASRASSLTVIETARVFNANTIFDRSDGARRQRSLQFCLARNKPLLLKWLELFAITPASTVVCSKTLASVALTTSLLTCYTSGCSDGPTAVHIVVVVISAGAAHLFHLAP